jgi:hypothetical protein
LRSLTVLTYCIASLNSLALFCSFLCFAHSFTSPTQEQRPLLAPRTCAPATAFSYTQGAQDRGKFTHTPSLLHTHTHPSPPSYTHTHTPSHLHTHTPFLLHTHTPSLLHTHTPPPSYTHTPFLLHTPFHTPRPQHWPLILTAIASLPPCCCVLMSSRCNAVIVPIS